MIYGMYTRRDFGKLALAAPVAAIGLRQATAQSMTNSKIDGVMIGAQSYSFRDRDLDGCIAGMKEVGLGYIELWQGHLEPKKESLQKAWRDHPPLDEIKAAAKKVRDAGIVLYAVNYSFREEFSDLQIENGFKIAQALGTDKITASSNVSTARRIDKYAKEYRIYVGFHGHDSMAKNEFSTPDDFKAAMDGLSKYMDVNLDIGHFTAAGFDPVKYIEEHHDRILTLHIKDRKKNHGANMPFGQGETNIKGVLQLLKAKQYPIPANIEYEYGKRGLDTVVEMKKCYAFMKAALA